MKNEENNNEEMEKGFDEKNGNDFIENKGTENNKIDNEKINHKKDNKGKKVVGIIKRILIIAILLGMVLFVLKTSKYYVDDRITDETNLIINNNNVTARLKEELIIEDGIVYLSMKDIQNFLDNYIYEEEETEQIITSSDKKIAAIGFESKNIVVNGANMKIGATAIRKDEEIYLPISELADVYDIEIEYVKDTDIVTIDSLDREQEKATTTKNVNVKLYAKLLSKTIDKIEKTDSVIVIKDVKNGWTKVRTENGIIGYIKTNKLADFTTVREEIIEEPQVDGKINMFWDYYSEYASAPDRTGQEIQGVNVVSPSFFYINNKSEFTDKVGTAGKKYIEWAHSNGYKVWPMLSNSEAGIKITSGILNSYEKRQDLIEEILDVCTEYNLDGINIDFEFMYEKDKDVFSRFIIELVPRMKEMGLVTSVDVTAPDGSPNWSLCYDRLVLGNVADYLAFMAYDQYGTSSTSAGTTAGYDWIELALNKFITTYEVEPEKIILGMPFYTRVWTETIDGDVSSKVVNMKNIESVLPNDAEKVWKEDVKQYYVEYQSGSSIKKIWIEDEKSIEEKVSLVSKYNLAGVSCWEKDREIDTIWKIIDEGLKEAE